VLICGFFQAFNLTIYNNFMGVLIIGNTTN